MNNGLEAYIKDIAINQLMSSPLGNKIEQAMENFEKVQKLIEGYLFIYLFTWGEGWSLV